MHVAVDEETENVMAIVVPEKGTDAWAAEEIVRFNAEMAREHSKIILKADQEPSIVALMRLRPSR